MPDTSMPDSRFRDRSELLDFMLEVASMVSQTLDLDQLLANIAEIVGRVLNYDLFAILLYSERSKTLRIRYSVGHRPEIVKNLQLALGEGITGSAAAAREPILVGDVRSDPRYLNAQDAVRSELAVPMIVRQKVVGVLDVQSSRPDAYDKQDTALLRLIASRVGGAIENARLYRRTLRQKRTLELFVQLSREFSSILDLDELLRKIASTVREVIHYTAFSILLLDQERGVLRHRSSMRLDQQVDLDNIPLGMGITGAAAQTRNVVRVKDTSKDPRYIALHPDIRSEVAMPLIVQDRVVGVMDLESDRVGFFTEEHVRTLSLLVPQIASAVENARLFDELTRRERRMDEDLRAASELQSVLLPTDAPEARGLEIALGLRPAREISGDIYEFFEHSTNRFSLAFGDVSGKSVAAALYGALVAGLLRTLGPRRPSPADLMKAMNDALIQRKVEARYATLLVMSWDASALRFTMANAGALPPMICRDGEILNCHVEGLPLGLLENSQYEQTPFQAELGDVIVLYSDGIPDQTDVHGEDYGRNRLARLVSRTCEEPAQVIVNSIYADVDSFSEGVPRQDDQTLLVMRIA